MSFWPFSSSFNSNSHLQKLLDSTADVSKINIDDLFEDRTIQSEFMDELKGLSTKYGKKTNFHLPSVQQAEANTKSSNTINDDSSVASSSNETTSNNVLSKTAREAKLMELVLQPHILMGLLDYIEQSVEFFYDLAIKEEEKLEDLVNKSDSGSLHSDNPSDEVRESRMEDAREEQEEDESKGEQADERLRRCIQGATDVLSLEFWVISNRIIETPVLMDKLWSVISMPHLRESSPAVGYLVSVLDHFLDSNSTEFLNYIRRRDNLVDTFLAKIEIPILMDFFIKIIQTDRADSPTGIIEVLSQQQLISKLIDILKPISSQFEEDHVCIPSYELLFRQTAAAELIKALISISSNSTLAVDLESNIGPNQLTRELASPKIINQMVHDIILYRIPGKTASDLPRTNKSGISNCVTILIELIRKNNSDYDLNCGTYSALLQNNTAEPTGEVSVYVMYQWLKDFNQNPPGIRDPVFLGDMLQIFSENMNAISELIDLDASVPAAAEKGSEALGVTKFKLFELIAELLHCSNMILLNSRKIAEIVRIRDKIRVLQESRLKDALAGSILDEESSSVDDEHIGDVTSGIDDVSLHDMSPETTKKTERSNTNELSVKNFTKLKMEQLNASEYVESDDEEPAVSQENPFVCIERDEMFRENPCIGDAFKIKLVDSNLLPKMLRKFVDYPWHNFFHNVVFDLIQQIFNGKLNSYNSFLIVELFKHDECNITHLIVDTFKSKAEPRPGYTGHLILISEEVVKFSSLYKPGLISPVIVDAVNGKDWEWFVENVLLKTRELYNAILGADPEYDDVDNMEGGTRRVHDDDSYGFDSSTVGYMDLEPYDEEQKNFIILGDSSNHDEFVSSKPQHPDDDEDAEANHKTDLADVRIQSMSPKSSVENHEDLVNDLNGSKFPGHRDELQEDNFFDDLSGSSSSDEDDDDHNELRRVPKHSES
ncbi:hypothetical protein FT663_00284 [Candidozyma haemuli var. vulneris]|nr:hypothetical protein FT662_04247 [[Candida] haemuloni var. vulneris]KAF3995537.1 hypothetical protein FT663_00284 [[Candida] haemuloni var. vulneris]